MGGVKVLYGILNPGTALAHRKPPVASILLDQRNRIRNTSMRRRTGTDVCVHSANATQGVTDLQRMAPIAPKAIEVLMSESDATDGP